ncbi:hypothetical protein C1645_818624 [Glomus cerebriforme]|uniref:Uncharacterized protein n=1 Tax=Glomus cerebriforme TaxID=658196 RepID=A0A397TCN7_9GLOM|nr:hypothetical protein C1645_818624 [Glomus cerebriforme]
MATPPILSPEIAGALRLNDVEVEDTEETSTRVTNQTSIINQQYDGILKEQIHAVLLFSASAHNQNWIVVSKGMCTVSGKKYLPDIGMWTQNLTLSQQRRPMVNACPPPNVWGGVALANTDNPFHGNPNPGLASVAEFNAMVYLESRILFTGI